MAVRKKPVPVVLNPPKGSKFREETVLVSFTESQILVEVVGKVGRATKTRYPRKVILDFNIANTEQINQIFSEDAPAKKTAKPKNGRKKAEPKKTTAPKNGRRKKKEEDKKPEPKKTTAPKNGRRKKKKAEDKKTESKKTTAPKNGRRKKKPGPKKTTKKDSGTSIPPRRTKGQAKNKPTDAKDPWGDDAWGF